MSAGGGAAARRRPLLGWVLLAALALYTSFVFYGVGVPARGIAQHWYEPRSFLSDAPGVAQLLDSTPRALVCVGVPALALTVAILVTGHSAVASALAVSFALACLLFTFYGVQAAGVWQFFGWRGSAVLWLLALCLGFALTAPLLAASWLRRSWPLRLALYLPLAFGVIAFVRNATGTDPALKYSISPWPAIPVFGIELGALLAVSWLTGAAIGATALARTQARRGGGAHGLRWLGIALGLATPALLLLAGGALDLLPFGVDARTAGPAVAVCGLTIAGVATGRVRGREHVLGLRAQRLAVGAVLIGLPVFAGQALARWDYYVTRERDARSVIDALASFYEREQLYPDALQELVESGDLGRVPTPSIGFSFLYDGDFRYESFGTSFILEFPAPRWVECAYTPPYEDEWEEAAAPDVAAAAHGELEVWEVDAAGGGEALGESWSCPSSPPVLW